MKRIVALVLTLIASVAGLSYAVLNARHAVDGVIPQPPTWVPFSCDLRITQPGYPPIVGKVYRASNGSTRRETGPEDQSGLVISITNMSLRSRYVFRTGRGWFVESEQVHEQATRPIRYSTRAQNIRRSTALHEGLELYEFDYRGAGRSLRPPAINFYPVIFDTPDGKHEVCSNVKRGVEPPADLFVPPAGEHLKILNIEPHHSKVKTPLQE